MGEVEFFINLDAVLFKKFGFENFGLVFGQMFIDVVSPGAVYFELKGVIKNFNDGSL